MDTRQSARLSEDQVLAQIVARLSAASPDAAILLFGSRAAGRAADDSDYDIMVVCPQVTSRRAEMVRLTDAVRGLGVGVDIVVVDRASYLDWCSEPGTVYHDAATEGKVLYGAAKYACAASPGV